MAKLNAIVTSINRDCSPERLAHQRMCVTKMAEVADHVIVLNDPDGLGFALANAVFVVPESNPPTVKEMLGLGLVTTRSSIIAIANSDIEIEPEVLGVLDVGKRIGQTWAATSFRYEYDTDKASAKVEGYGLDLFVMTGRVGLALYDNVPQFLTVGRSMWDNWMNGWLRKHMQHTKYFDLTPWRVVFHARHEREAGRLSNYTDEQVAACLHDVSCGGIPKQTYANPRGKS